MVTWKRTLRTAASERFLATRAGVDLAAVDLHYLPNGTVAGTVILLQGSGLGAESVPELLKQLDEEFLPDVEIGDGNVSFTVVEGKVLGNYEGCSSEA